MSAEQSALAVLDWSGAPAGPPPRGDLQDLEALVQPGAAARAALARSAAVAAARLGLSGLLPTGSGGGSAALGIEPLWLAAAIANAPQEAAEALIRACPPTRSLPDLIARHALVAPALEYLPGATAEQCLLCSPLTAVLLLPPQGGEDEAILLCERLAAIPAGRRLILHRFADPEPHAGKLAWRGRQLAALRLTAGQGALVVDLYEAAVAQHGPDWLTLIRRARRLLATGTDQHDIDLALAAGRWWDPLRAIYRADKQAVRERGYLQFQVYLEGIRLAAVTAWLRDGQH